MKTLLLGRTALVVHARGQWKTQFSASLPFGVFPVGLHCLLLLERGAALTWPCFASGASGGFQSFIPSHSG